MDDMGSRDVLFHTWRRSLWFTACVGITLLVLGGGSVFIALASADSGGAEELALALFLA